MFDQASNILQRYITPSMLWSPKEIDYSDKIVHVPFLFWLVEVSKPKIIVQLGANQSAYYEAYCYAVKTLSYDTHCYIIDSWFESENNIAKKIGHGGWGLLPFTKKEYLSFSSLLHASFDTAKNHFDRSTIDLLHISGNISRKNLKDLISEWKDKLSDQAVILVDQIYQFYGNSENKAAWEELKDNYPSFSFFTAEGLGVIGFGENLPITLKNFFSDIKDEKIKASLRNIFSDLGIKFQEHIKITQSHHEKECEELKAELQAIYTSRSWKMMKSLKLLKKGFTHLISKKKLKNLTFPINAIPDLQDLKNWKSEAKIAVIFHIYYPDLWNELRLTLTNLSEPFDLFISLVKAKSDYLEGLILSEYPQANIKIFPNHGRDIFPFIHFINAEIFNRYDAILKLHTKKTPHLNYGDVWRQRTYFSLADSKETVKKIIQNMRDDKSLGIICAPNAICDQRFWHNTKKRTKELAKRIHCKFSANNIHFSASTMFWINPTILDLLQSLNLKCEDFEIEQGQVNDTTAHAIERLIGILCESFGMQICEVSEILF